MLDIDFNDNDEELREILGQSRVIAMVGESNDHYYTSYQVAEYLKKMGYIYGVSCQPQYQNSGWGSQLP